MGDTGEVSSSEVHRREPVPCPKQGFAELPVDYGTILILCSYEVYTIPCCSTMFVLFLYNVHTILCTNAVLFAYDYSAISFHTIPVQCLYNACTMPVHFMMAVSIRGFTLVIRVMYNVNTMHVQFFSYDYNTMLIPFTYDYRLSAIAFGVM